MNESQRRWPEVSFWEVCGVHESGRSHLVLLPRRVDVAAQNPFRRYPCKYLNLRTHKLDLSAARKQVYLALAFVVVSQASGRCGRPSRAAYLQFTPDRLDP